MIRRAVILFAAVAWARCCAAGPAEEAAWGLRSPDAGTRAAAAMSLAELGRGALPALGAIRGALHDADPNVRYWAACDVGTTGPAAADAAPGLIALLSDSGADVQFAAIWALGEIGPGAGQAAIAALFPLLSSRYGEITRSNAATALVKIGPAALPGLIAALGSDDMQIRFDVTSALRGKFGLEDDPGVPNTTPRHVAELAALNFPAGFNEGVSRIANGSFEETGVDIPGWKLMLEDGATGSAQVVEGPARTGKRFLRIMRTNALGNLYLRSAAPVTVGAKEFAVFRAFFQAQDAPLNSALQLRFDDERGWLYPGDEYNGQTRLSQTLLRNTPPGYWDKRVAEYRSDGAAHKVWVRVYLQGNPCTVALDDVAFPAAPWNVRYSAPVMTLPVLDEASALARLKQRCNADAKVVRQDGGVRLLVEGKPVAPVIYQTLTPNFADYAYMERYGGIRLQAVPVDLSDVIDRRYPVSFPVWPTVARRDFTTPFRSLQRLTATAPESYALLEFSIVWPVDWVDRHPQEVWTDAQGHRAYGTAMHIQGFGDTLPAGMRWWPSPCSEQALADAAAVMRDFITQLKGTPYYNIVVGTIITGGHDGQFYTGWPDYSEPGKRCFREWLRARYGSVERLRAAWQDATVTFETANIPSPTRPASRDPLAVTFFDPLTETPLADHRKFMTERGLVIREYFARAFKEAIGKDTIALTYHMGGGKGDGAEAIFLNSRYLDGLTPQPSYELRMPGHIGGLSALLDACNLHGKLMIEELDLRTWLRSGGSEIVNQREGAAMSPAMFRDIQRKEIGQMLARGQGYWYFDIGTTHFRDRAIMSEINATRAIATQLMARADTFRPNVCIVSDEDSQYACAEDRRGSPAPLQGFGDFGLKTSGVPFDQHTLRDVVANPDLWRYKVYVFEDTYRLSAEQRRFINEKLKRDGRTLVWMYGAGFVTETGLSADAVSETVGLRVSVEKTPKPTACHAAKSDDPLAAGLPSLQGMGEMYQQVWSLPEPPYFSYDVQRFSIDDPAAVVLARYRDGAAAIAARRFKEWTSIYVAPPGGLDAALLNNIARQAGAFVALKPGPALEMNGNFLSLHGTVGGRYEVALPRRCTVREADGAIIARDATDFTADIQAQRTYWYLLE